MQSKRFLDVTALRGNRLKQKKSSALDACTLPLVHFPWGCLPSRTPTWTSKIREDSRALLRQARGQHSHTPSDTP